MSKTQLFRVRVHVRPALCLVPFALSLLLSACSPAAPLPTPLPTQTPTPTSTTATHTAPPITPTTLSGPALQVPAYSFSLGGPTFKIVPDGEFVYGPATQDFDVAAYLEAQPGFLKTLSAFVAG